MRRACRLPLEIRRTFSRVVTTDPPEANGRLDRRSRRSVMFKRAFASGLVAIFLAIVGLAGTVQSSSAHGMHHHHHHRHSSSLVVESPPSSSLFLGAARLLDRRDQKGRLRPPFRYVRRRVAVTMRESAAIGRRFPRSQARVSRLVEKIKKSSNLFRCRNDR